MVLRGDSLVAAFNTAVIHGKMGDVALIEGKTSQAVPDYEEALRVVSRLAAAEPLNASIRQQEALSLVELGHAFTGVGPDRRWRSVRPAGVGQARSEPEVPGPCPLH